MTTIETALDLVHAEHAGIAGEVLADADFTGYSDNELAHIARMLEELIARIPVSLPLPHRTELVDIAWRFKTWPAIERTLREGDRYGR